MSEKQIELLASIADSMNNLAADDQSFVAGFAVGMAAAKETETDEEKGGD